MTTCIEIIDAAMGTGKSTYILEKIQNCSATDLTTRFIYISPYLSEVGNPTAAHRNRKRQEELRKGRAGLACPAAQFKQPTGRKRDHLQRLLACGENITCTHKLFEIMSNDSVELIREHNYEIVIDEAMAVVQGYTGLTTSDRDLIMQSIIVDEDYRVSWPGEHKGRYDDVKALAEEGRLFYYKDQFFIWELPPAILHAAKKVTILTYQFEASIMSAWLRSYKIPFSCISNEAIGLKSESTVIAEAKNLIEIVSDPYVAKLGNRAMSSTGYDNLSSDELKKMKGEIEKLVERKLKAKSKQLIWTCFGKNRKALKGKGYSRGFVSCNTRATNDYADRQFGIYLVNRYPHHNLRTFMRAKKSPLNDDAFALAEMLQWIWRLRIRVGKSIKLVIPSRRMRNLLQGWLEMPLT